MDVCSLTIRRSQGEKEGALYPPRLCCCTCTVQVQTDGGAIGVSNIKFSEVFAHVAYLLQRDTVVLEEKKAVLTDGPLDLAHQLV